MTTRTTSRFVLVASVVLVVAACWATAAYAAPLTNGGFETGTLAGWTSVTAGANTGYTVYSGTPTVSGHTLAAPPEGTSAIVSNQGGPGSGILYQDITLPASGTITLSMYVYYQSSGSDRDARRPLVRRRVQPTVPGRRDEPGRARELARRRETSSPTCSRRSSAIRQRGLRRWSPRISPPLPARRYGCALPRPTTAETFRSRRTASRSRPAAAAAGRRLPRRLLRRLRQHEPVHRRVDRARHVPESRPGSARDGQPLHGSDAGDLRSRSRHHVRPAARRRHEAGQGAELALDVPTGFYDYWAKP